MTLKQKSILVYFCSYIVLTSAIIGTAYLVIVNKFQDIENQRVARNNRRVAAILEDRLNQIKDNLGDWAIWDDTYQFMIDRNPGFIKSNMSQESFVSSNIDKALFIDKNGDLALSFQVDQLNTVDTDFPTDLYSHFSSDKILPDKGLIKTKNGLLMFSLRNIKKSDGTGEPNGSIVFARYLNEKVLNTLKELTQFNADMWFWDEPNLPSDFQISRKKYVDSGQSELITTTADQTISGFLVIKDIYNQPQAIVRTDIIRDITSQGSQSLVILTVAFIIAGIFIFGINYWLVNGFVLEKISQMSTDVNNLGKSDLSSGQLQVNSGADEVDQLRANVNKMLNQLQTSESKLTQKEQFINKVMDRLPLGIAVNYLDTGKTLYVNPSFEKIYGWSKDNFQSVDDFFAHVYPNQQTLKSKVLADIASGDPSKMVWENLEITTSTGEKRYVNAANIPLSDQNLTISTVQDVTEQKKYNDSRHLEMTELENLNNLMINRELKMVELKEELEKLKSNK